MKNQKGLRGIFISINTKIIIAFAILYVIYLVFAVNTVFTLDKGVERITESVDVVNPSIDEINDFRLMVTQSQLYSMSWVHEHTDIRPKDKEALKEIHRNFEEFQDEFKDMSEEWTDRNLKQALDSVFQDFRELINFQEKIMKTLVEFEDYENFKLEAENILNNFVLPKGDIILKKLNQIAQAKNAQRMKTQSDLIFSFKGLRNIIVIAAFTLVFTGLIVSYFSRRLIVRPIKYINDVFVKLGKGQLPEDKHQQFNNDEIGEMAESVDKLVFSLKQTSRFAERIGKGDYKASFTPLSEEDVLGNALIEMRDNLSKVAKEDQRRNWTNEGIVKFSELLKENNSDVEQLADSIISHLVNYVKASQGGLFVVDNDAGESGQNGEDLYMTLASCYAWDSKKYVNKKVYQGDGLAGQAWQEHNTIYLTEVPDDYVLITSGLGKANPSSILIVPLKINDEVFGVVELASFDIFEDYQIEFVEKIAESIASAIASMKINARTKRLLDESTLMTEQMKSQEEEMRQNMEELQATKEHIESAQREAKEKEALIETAYLVIETDKKFTINEVNDFAEAKLKYDGIDFEGMAIDYLFFSYEKIDEAKARLAKGVKWIDFVYLKGNDNTKLFVKASASSVKNENDAIEKYIFIFDDITDATS